MRKVFSFGLWGGVRLNSGRVGATERGAQTESTVAVVDFVCVHQAMVK